MSQRDDLDQLLSAWIEDPNTPPAPRYLGQVLERTRRSRQLPAWASLERWNPMASDITQPAAARPQRLALLLLIVLVVVAAVAIVLVGSRVLKSPVTIPQGGAAVFAYDSNGDIFTVRADGTDVRRLTIGADQELAPSWSPDGTRIAYRLWRDGDDSVAVMDVGAGSQRTLASLGQVVSAQCVPYGLAAWSPDGRAIIVPSAQECEGPQDLIILATDGSTPAAKLVATDLNSSSAAWSPDGRQIVFVGREATGSNGLYVVDVAGKDNAAGGLQPRRITAAGSNLVWLEPRWSPDGTEIAVSVGTNADCGLYDTGTLDVVAVKADGSGQRVLADTPAKEYVPTWSPDGRRVAFQRLVDQSEWINERPCTTAAWVVDKDGSNARRLEGFGPDPVAPVWSPDGTRIMGAWAEPNALFLSFVTVDGSAPIVKVNVDGYFLNGTWQPLAAPMPSPSFATLKTP
jgi:TolB protein